MTRLGAGESLRRPKIPCPGEENPCPGKKNSLRRKDREFAASHWKCNINSFRNRRLCAQSERIRCQIPCRREFQSRSCRRGSPDMTRFEFRIRRKVCADFGRGPRKEKQCG